MKTVHLHVHKYTPNFTIFNDPVCRQILTYRVITN